MNNGRFDLKRKLAFVAALAFTANSAYSVPAAGAETSAAVMSVEPVTVDAPDDVVPPPVENSDDGSNDVVYTVMINNSDIDDDTFIDIMKKVFRTEIKAHSFDESTGAGSITVGSLPVLNRNDVYNNAEDMKFRISSENGFTLVFDTYYKVSGFGGDERISLRNSEGDDISDGFCKGGTDLEFVPSDLYIIDNGTEPVRVPVSAPVSVSTDNPYNDGYELIVNRDRHTVSPRTFSLDVDGTVFDVLVNGVSTERRSFEWKEVSSVSLKTDGKQALYIKCGDKDEIRELYNNEVNCSVFTQEPDFSYINKGVFTIKGIDSSITAFASFDETNAQVYKNYKVPVTLDTDSGCTVSVPYLAGDGYCLSSYTYDGETTECLAEMYDALVNGQRAKVIPYHYDVTNIKLVYRKLADNGNAYVFKPEADLFERNKNCYSVSSKDALVDLMDFTSLFDGSTLLYDVFRKGSGNSVENKKFYIGESSREFTESMTDSSESALYIVKNIISKGETDSLIDGLDGIICFYSDKTAPKVEFTRGHNSDSWVGREGMSFAMRITDKEDCPIAESGDLTFDESEIVDIYKYYINKETVDCSEIYSVVVGDYRFDRPAKGWGDTANIKGYVETPDMRAKYNAAVAELSKLKLSDINSSYSDQLNYDGYYRKLLREHSASLIDDMTEYYDAKIAAESEKDEPDQAKIDSFRAQCDKYVGVVRAYMEAQNSPVRASKCMPVLTYDRAAKEFRVSVKAESAHENEMIDEMLSVFAYDDSNNSSWDNNSKKQIRVKIDGAPPAVADNKINISGDTVIKDSNNTDVHVLKAGSVISVAVNDIESSVKGSGVNDVKIYFGDEKDSAESMTQQNGMYIFNIVSDAVKDVNIKSYITIYAMDSVGNSAVMKSKDSKYGGFYIIIDDTAPTCSVKNVSDTAEPYIDENDGGKEWYKAYSDVKIAVAAEDPNSLVCSGIRELKLDINGHHCTVNVDAQSGIDKTALKNGGYNILFEAVQDPDRFKAKLVSADGKVLISELGEFSRNDGAINVKLSTNDYAGNESEESETKVWIDLSEPTVESVYADGADLRRDERYGYVYFAREQADVQVSVNRNGAGAGLDRIEASLVNSDGTPSALVPKISRNGSSDSWTVTVPDRFKGFMRVKAVSCMGRESDVFETALFAVENTDDHRENAHIRLELPETQYKDINGFPLYSDDISAKLTVKENFSGISNVYISSSGTADRYLYVNESGELSGNEAELWSIDEDSRDINLVNGLERDILLTGNSNNSVAFVSFGDRAGNPDDQDHTYDRRRYSIDKTDPVMNVVFTDGNGSADSEFKQIFKASRRAVITINERNFDKSLADIRVNNISRQLDWRLVSGTEGTDSATYQAEIAFDNDGTYRLTASFKDMCGREAKSYDSKEFVIDRTAPAMNIGFDRSIANDHYYNEPTTATFRISDQNFDPSRIVVTGTYNDSAEDFPKASEWTKSGNDYVSTVRFEKDGDYTVNITGKDMAGNTLEAYNAKFCIDSQSPKISVSDVSAANNKAEIRPHIQFKDANLDKDSIQVKMEGANRGKSLEVEGELREKDDGYEYVLNNIPDNADYDDIYTITASAKDNASNKVETDFRFSVNRYGSTFMLDEGTGSLVGKYISRAQDIVITEVNADKHSEPYSVYITKDSEMSVLKDNVDYKVEYKGGDDEWSEYKYIIYAKNFEKDGRYTVSIHSVDEAGNINISTSEKKNTRLEFCVDTTEPLCIPLNVTENSAYKGERLDAKMSVSDNIMLKGAKVFLNDKEIRSRYIDDEYLEFTIPNAKHSQDVKIVLTDMAGNEIEYSYKNILVTTNAVRLLAHKTWFKFVCGGAVLLTGAAAFLIRKRKKRLL